VAFRGGVVSSSATWAAGVASWFKAAAFCHDLGGSLAVFDDPVSQLTGENAKKLVDYLTQVQAENDGSFWIGLRRNPWLWFDSFDPDNRMSSITSPMYYTDWLEPDQPTRDTQNCVRIGANDERYGWYNERCETRAPFVCENYTQLQLPSTENETQQNQPRNEEFVEDFTPEPDNSTDITANTSSWTPDRNPGDENANSSKAEETQAETEYGEQTSQRVFENTTKSSHRWTPGREDAIIVGCVIGFAALFAMCVGTYLICRNKRRDGYSPQP